jgi:hypothetical protein
VSQLHGQTVPDQAAVHTHLDTDFFKSGLGDGGRHIDSAEEQLAIVLKGPDGRHIDCRARLGAKRGCQRQVEMGMK